MKLKKMWIPLFPAMLIMAGIKVYQQYLEYSKNSLFGKDSVIASYATIGIVILLFIVLLVMHIANRDTAPVYNYKRNVPAGAMCLFAASVTVIDLGCYLPSIFLYGTFSVSVIVNMIFSAASAIGLYFLSWAHISTKKPPVQISLFLLVIPAWSIVKLLTSLFHNSSISVVMTDVMDLFIYLFLSLFLFFAISVICVLEGKNPVKRVMLFGIPLVALLFTYDVSILWNIILNGYYSGASRDIFSAVEMTMFALYAILFMRELTLNAKSKKDIKIIDDPVELQALIDKKKEEKLKEFEEARDKERESGNYYITVKNEYDAEDAGSSHYGLYGTYRSHGTYGRYGSYSSYGTYTPRGVYGDAGSAYINENDDTFLISTDEENALDQQSAKPLTGKNNEELSMSHIDRLILEITSGDNDLDIGNIDREENQ